MRFEKQQVATWILRAQALAKNRRNGDKPADAFCIILEKICLIPWPGACHDTSAAMYVIFSDLGFLPTLCVGEVISEKSHFDHSWVELDGIIYDAAVCSPADGIEYVSAPIFSSQDLSFMRRTGLIFGQYQSGLAETAKTISTQTLGEYSIHIKQRNPGSQVELRRVIAHISSYINLSLDPRAMQNKYGTVRRTVRGQ
jgi:hypothetical protein